MSDEDMKVWDDRIALEYGRRRSCPNKGQWSIVAYKQTKGMATWDLCFQCPLLLLHNVEIIL
jgi:hypothetical protein